MAASFLTTDGISVRCTERFSSLQERLAHAALLRDAASAARLMLDEGMTIEDIEVELPVLSRRIIERLHSEWSAARNLHRIRAARMERTLVSLTQPMRTAA